MALIKQRNLKKSNQKYNFHSIQKVRLMYKWKVCD